MSTALIPELNYFLNWFKINLANGEQDSVSRGYLVTSYVRNAPYIYLRYVDHKYFYRDKIRWLQYEKMSKTGHCYFYMFIK
jgi:hypothetical protein